ncbi:MAG: TIGR02253 family HAD-type hydrolase [Candidatus Aenigmarchaeota archaeon]|nr:TIGR02253 family HAD-type hydrolase [Candidatus Aenigmarchaeota archaeon]
MPVKAVMFDLDNTLIDFLKMKRMSVEAAITAMIDAGLPMKKEKAMRVLWDLYDDYGIEYGKIFQKFLKKTMGAIDWKVLASGVVAYRSVKAGFLEPYPHVIPTLLKLKERGLKLGVVSDAPRMKAWLRLASMKIADFFDVVVTLNDADGHAKPHPLPYEVALRKLGLKPEEVVFVGDNPNRDILGAKRLGIRTVLAKYGEWTKAKDRSLRPDHEIDDVKELLKVLEMLL